MDINAVLNVAVVVALLFLAVSLTLLVASVMPLLRQLEQTTMSARKLMDTIDNEAKPTFHELRGMIDGVNQIKALTAQRVQDVGTKAEELTGSVNTLVGSAKKESSIAKAGIMAGFKAYFLGHGQENAGNKDNGSAEPKTIQMNRERKNVELKH